MEKRTNQKDQLNRERKRRTDKKSSGGSLSEGVKRAAQGQKKTDDVMTARAKEVFQRRNHVTVRSRTMEEFEATASKQDGKTEKYRASVGSRFADSADQSIKRESGRDRSRDRNIAGSTQKNPVESRAKNTSANRFAEHKSSAQSSSKSAGTSKTPQPSSKSAGTSRTPKSSKSTGSSRTTHNAGQTSSATSSVKASARRRTNAVKKRRMEQEAKRRRNRKRFGCLLNIILLLLVLSVAGIAIKKHFSGGDIVDTDPKVTENGTQDGNTSKEKKTSEDKAEKQTEVSDRDEDTEENQENSDHKDLEPEDLEIIEIGKDVLETADLYASQYDYDAAIKKIKEIEGYKNVPQLMERIQQWKSMKENLVAYSAEDVTHIFYHTLVVDPELAFECAPSIAEGFKMWMTTTEEFDRITKKMYEDGYVLCSLYDFFEETKDTDGTPHFKDKSVYLPADKKPFILSLDDLSYYHTYTGRGMATKLVLDKNGKITCEYKNRDGSISRGPYDCVPRLNDFMEAHPDGCYRGARGTIALTGYNGIFGYRTDKSYVTRENLDQDKVDWLNAHPDYDYEKECAKAKKIAKELKEEGWDFASHTWGHIRIGNSNLARIQRDTEKWKANVEPIIGHTECIIFAHGQDLASVDEYDTATNKKYQYLTNKGFHIYLNVDSHQKTMKVHDEYVHGGRRNLDGYRLWNDAHGKGTWTNDLFDASTILDSRRKDMPNPD